MVETKGIESLIVWQKAMSFAIHVQQQLLPSLPSDEKWSLSMQLRRSAQSIPANIAEGYGRYYYQESIRFCYLARGSLEEAYTQIALAHQLEYISTELAEKAYNDIQELRRLLNGYIAFLKKSKRGVDEPGSTHGIHEQADAYITDPDLGKDDLTTSDQHLI